LDPGEQPSEADRRESGRRRPSRAAEAAPSARELESFSSLSGWPGRKGKKIPLGCDLMGCDPAGPQGKFPWRMTETGLYYQITHPSWVQSMPGWRPGCLARLPGETLAESLSLRGDAYGRPASSDVIESEYDTMPGSRRSPVVWLRRRRPGGLAMSSRPSTVHFGHARTADDGGAGDLATELHVRFGRCVWPSGCLADGLAGL
jgi:hypothetical protein